MWVKPKKTKMLISQEFSNCDEPLSQEWIYRDTNPSICALRKTKYTRSSIVSYLVTGLE